MAKEKIKANTEKDCIIDKVAGTNKKRDFVILQALATGFTEEEVSSNTTITQQRISQIAINNFDLLNELTMRAELATKGGRMRKAFRIIKSKHKSIKDPLEWLEYIRKEVEGSSKAVHVSVNNTNIQQTQNIAEAPEEDLDSIIKQYVSAEEGGYGGRLSRESAPAHN